MLAVRHDERLAKVHAGNAALGARVALDLEVRLLLAHGKRGQPASFAETAEFVLARVAVPARERERDISQKQRGREKNTEKRSPFAEKNKNRPMTVRSRRGQQRWTVMVHRHIWESDDGRVGVRAKIEDHHGIVGGDDRRIGGSFRRILGKTIRPVILIESIALFCRPLRRRPRRTSQSRSRSSRADQTRSRNQAALTKKQRRHERCGACPRRCARAPHDVGQQKRKDSNAPFARLGSRDGDGEPHEMEDQRVM